MAKSIFISNVLPDEARARIPRDFQVDYNDNDAPRQHQYANQHHDKHQRRHEHNTHLDTPDDLNVHDGGRGSRFLNTTH